MRRQLIICLLLAGITLSIYWPAGGYDRVLLDDPDFLDNPEVQSGLTGHSFLWAMTSPVAANWHPVATLSFVLTHQCFGTNPGAEHIVNVVVHALNAMLLFLALQRLTVGTLPMIGDKTRPSDTIGTLKSGIRGTGAPGRTRPTTSDTTWPCAVVAALFAWHPLRVESVVWIAERKDVLCAFFMLLALWAYAAFAQRSQSPKSEIRNPKSETSLISSLQPPANLHYWLALFFFALGLLSKAMVVTLPFLLLLLDIWPLKRITFGSSPLSTINHQLSTLAWEKWPFFLLSVLFCLITFEVQRYSDATPSLHELGLGIRLENVIVSYWRYLGWSFWPANLAAYYTFPYNNPTYHYYLTLWPGWVIAAAALALTAVSILCVMQIARRPYLTAGWFWYLGSMVPVIGLVQVGSQGMADRYTYIPMIGPVISVVWLIWEQWGSRTFARPVLAVLAIVILTGSIFQTRHQLQYWQNTNILFQHTIDVTGENPRAEYLLGLGFEHNGDIARAMVHYRNAIVSQPRVKEAFYAMARLLAQQGKWIEAGKACSILVEEDPNDFTANLGLATTLPHLDRTAEAVVHLKTAIQNCPDDPQSLNNLAWTLATSATAELRDGAQAVKCGERACLLTGYRQTIVVGTLGAAYAEAGRFDDAVATAQRACELAKASGEAGLLDKNQELLALYRTRQAYHEPVQ